MSTSPAHVNTDYYDRDTLAFVKPITVTKHSAELLFKFKPEFSSRVSFQRERFYLIKSRLDQIRNLSQNWDGNGSVAIKQRVIINTFNFLNILRHDRILALEPENIAPTPYGTIELDWQKDGCLLSIEIGLNKIGFFSKFPDQSNPSSDGFLFNGTKIPLTLAQAFDKFFANAK